MSQKIIFDTDPGIDDAMALVFADRSPAIDLLGITTVLGNASIETVTRNALYIADRFDMPTPVFRGAAEPLIIPPGDVPHFVHGHDGLGNIQPTPPRREVSSLPAAEFIADSLRRYPGQVTLVAVGRLTNLALALEMAPDIAGKAKQVVLMGGALGIDGHTGNVTPHAEANIWGDPHAAAAVFAASWPVVMIGLDVTMQVIMHEDRMLRLKENADDAGAFIYDISRFYADFYRLNSDHDGLPVHDSSAVAYVIDPTLFTCRQGRIDVVTDGERIGNTSLHEPAPGSDERVQTAAIAVDAPRLLALYEETLCLEVEQYLADD
jgi:inosine-uridine nucleoside N-ribohydrolase